MNPSSFETTVVNGHIELPAGITLPENSRVRVTVTDATSIGRIATPRLADPDQISDFQMEVTEVPDAGV